MFVVVLLLFILSISSGSIAYTHTVNYTCSPSGVGRSMTFKRASDGVSGRYTATLCTIKNPNVTEWKIDLSYYDKLNFCNASSGQERERRLLRPGHAHSTNVLDINDPTNCSHVCCSMDFDLIFNGCYNIKSTLIEGKKSNAPFDTFHSINGSFTKDSIFNIASKVTFFDHDNDISLNWYLGIPLTKYRVDLCNKRNNTMECRWWRDVTEQCQAGVRELFCVLDVEFGCYRAELTFEAPWTAGVFTDHTNKHYDFCHLELAPPVHVVGGARAWWWAAGAALLLLALLALLLRRTLRRGYLKHALDRCFNRDLDSYSVESRSEECGAAEPTCAKEVCSRPVLLLYAREGELGHKAVQALKTLIQKATGGQVYDLFSAEVTALSACAPARWLRELLQRDDVRVLLLQSPAAAALYRAPLTEHDAQLTLQEPLLGRRAMYRVPQFGDQLLQLALSLLAETPACHHKYHKYYLATYSDLETDILAQVVPYRRYFLPEAAPALLHDLAGQAACEPSLLHDLTQATHDFVMHVQGNPNYLMDELIIM